MENTKNVRPILLVFALSNMAALIYQISWTKSLSYVFGTSMYAIGTVLACFMAGLALGSFVFGRRADKSSNPVRLFAYVEISLGLFALFLIPVFTFLPQPYAALHNVFKGQVMNFMLFALSFQILIIPASLIGGTFPIMNRIYAHRIKTIGEDVGVVYSVDTVFAALGAISAGFILLPLIGISKTVAIAAAINILAGLYLYNKSGKMSLPAKNTNGREKPISFDVRIVQAVLLCFFLSGFAALAAEVVWIRFLSLTLGTSVYALSIITAAFLTGLSLGSFLIGRYMDRIKVPITTFAFIELCIGLSGILVILLFDKLDIPYLVLYHTFDSFYPFTVSLFILIFLIILVPATLMGTTMPLVGKIVSNKFEYIGTDIGAAYTVNTFGAIFGTFLTSFIFIPSIGITKTAALVGAISISVGLVLFFYSERKWKNIFCSLAGISVILCIYLASTTISPLFAGAYYHGTQLKDVESWKNLKSSTELVHYEEGLYGLVSIVKKDKYIALRIDGKSESSNVPMELASERQLAYIPLFASRAPKEVMLIGLGGGFTLEAITNFDEIESIHLVEINPILPGAVKKYLSGYNNHAIDDNRVNIIIDDGRNYLASSDRKYDVIISQPSNIWLSGEAGLFTKEMYEIAKTDLKDGGIFGQWMPLYEQNTDDFKVFLATFGSVFPYTDLWIVGYDAILVGSMQPIEYDYGNMRNHLTSNYKIKSDFEMMSDVLVTHGTYRLLYQMIIPYRMSEGGIKEFSGGVINTDDHPFLEFSTARNSIYQQNVKKPFEAVNGFLQAKSNLILSPSFTNMTAMNGESINMTFINLEIRPGNQWKEDFARINTDHGRNVVYMEAAYSRAGSQLSILAFPLPEQTITAGMKENIIRSMKAGGREVVIDGNWGYEVKSPSGGSGGFDYKVSWFCDNNDILYNIEMKSVTDREEQGIIESIRCQHV